MTRTEAIFQMLSDGRARTIKEIAAEIDPPFSSPSVAKVTIDGILGDTRRFSRRRRPAKSGRASFEYVAVAPEAVAAPKNHSNVLAEAILAVLNRGGSHYQDDIVREVTTATCATADQVRIRLTVMAARGEIARISLYRAFPDEGKR